MKRLTEHNDEVLKERAERARLAKLTGVLCPECQVDNELLLITESNPLWSTRPIGTLFESAPVYCEVCGFVGLMELEGK